MSKKWLVPHARTHGTSRAHLSQSMLGTLACRLLEPDQSSDCRHGSCWVLWRNEHSIDLTELKTNGWNGPAPCCSIKLHLFFGSCELSPASVDKLGLMTHDIQLQPIELSAENETTYSDSTK